MTRTYVDACVLVAAIRGEGRIAQDAIDVIDDPSRALVSSIFTKLELLPKPTYNGYPEEAQFYEAFFKECVQIEDGSTALLADAFAEAMSHGLGAVDALHVVAAEACSADELVTAERSTSPIHRTTRVTVTTIR